MDLEQFDCIVKAIVEGKYSWACVLILRFAGYNPAHYIPYRTYKRLIKENRRSKTIEPKSQETISQQPSENISIPSSTPSTFPQGMYRMSRMEASQK
ncbi:HetP family heterocyst commitment protein [Egbenema bharatensis]|uniref:HetP family heterocyst commitment protein n=1 Tax=Egbenema bharatensis TaxID=3463334 RepID=UPI003A84B197